MITLIVDHKFIVYIFCEPFLSLISTFSFSLQVRIHYIILATYHFHANHKIVIQLHTSIHHSKMVDSNGNTGVVFFKIEENRDFPFSCSYSRNERVTSKQHTYSLPLFLPFFFCFSMFSETNFIVPHPIVNNKKNIYHYKFELLLY